MPIYWVTAAQGTAATTVAVPIWNSQTSAAGPAFLTTSGLYQAMTNQSTSSASTNAYCNAATWDIWVDNSQYYYLAQGRAVTYRVRTEEERLRQQEQHRQAILAAEQRTRENQAALTRSRDLLLAHLSEPQRKTFENSKWFVVEGGKTKQKYRIRTETYAGNIDVLNGSRVSHRLCVHCDSIPLYDHHLAQKLALEFDEERLLQIANRQAA